MEIISYLEVNNYNLKLVGYNILRVRKKEERKERGRKQSRRKIKGQVKAAGRKRNSGEKDRNAS